MIFTFSGHLHFMLMLDGRICTLGRHLTLHDDTTPLLEPYIYYTFSLPQLLFLVLYYQAVFFYPALNFEFCAVCILLTAALVGGLIGFLSYDTTLRCSVHTYSASRIGVASSSLFHIGWLALGIMV